MVKEQHAELPASLSWRLFLVGFGMLQITLGAGLIVGWAGIAGSMLVSTEGGAGLTLDQTTQMFGLAASVNYLSPLFLGVLLDHFGPRTCSAISNSFVALGCFVFSSSTNFTVLSIGICLVAFGGSGVQTSLIHIGNLFPESRFFVMGVVSETITLSFAILPLMDLIWEQTSIGFEWIFAVYGVILTISAVLSCILWPDAPYMTPSDGPVQKRESVKPPPPVSLEPKQPFKSYLREDTTKLEQTESFLKSEKALLQGRAEDVSLKDMPFHKQLTSGVYLRVSIFFFITSFWANFYVATVTTEVSFSSFSLVSKVMKIISNFGNDEQLGDFQVYDKDKQHELARLLSFIDAGAIVCAPLSGYLLDNVGFIPTAVITITLGILQMLLILIADDNPTVLIVSFFLYAVFRAFLFPYFFATLSRKIGFKYFGMLTGISFAASGMSQLGIAPLATAVEGTCHESVDMPGLRHCSFGNWNMTHSVQMVCLAFLFLVPLIDYYIENKGNKLSAISETETLVAESSGSSYGSIPSISKAQAIDENEESEDGDQYIL